MPSKKDMPPARAVKTPDELKPGKKPVPADDKKSKDKKGPAAKAPGKKGKAEEAAKEELEDVAFLIDMLGNRTDGYH